MKPNPWTMLVMAIVVIGAVAAGALLLEPKTDGPFERLGENIDKAVR